MITIRNGLCEGAQSFREPGMWPPCGAPGWDASLLNAASLAVASLVCWHLGAVCGCSTGSILHGRWAW